MSGKHKPRKRRVIEQLRSHSEVGGVWRFDADANEYVREDGLRVFGRAHISIDVGGGESYYTSWYQLAPGEHDAKPLYGILRGRFWS